uniref:Uncharacterized protein n=1 Tax=Acrobeloides nanus TaxID=290746 RepID=A0A914CFH4_9BILA
MGKDPDIRIAHEVEICTDNMLNNIIVKDDDLFSLCLKCNNKGFMRLPLPLVKFLFIQNARKKGIDFLAYTKDDEKTAWKELLNYKPEEYDGICCKVKISSLDENDKTKWITARLSDGLIDISTRLLNGDRAPYGPVKLNLSNFEVRRLFQHPGTIYHACYHCGRIDYHSDYPVDENKDANNNVKLSTPVPAESPRILTTVSATDYFALKNLIP